MDDTPTIVTPLAAPTAPGARWQPTTGPEAQGLVERTVGAQAGEALIDAANSILARGVSPTQPTDHVTGLVVGYVQSGKTLSFTTVMALARDNNYQLVIVVAGTSKPLLDQSTQRLRKDLRVDDVEGSLRWVTYTNPPNQENTRRYIQQALDDWRDPQVPPGEKATVLITAMKNHRHLANLIALLKRLNLTDVPTLVIDDEADQASLNTLVKRGRDSTTYTRLLELRNVVPCHLFLQYTATPQAPLLINIIDALSPEFVEVLEPGGDYVGGETFFSGTHNLTAVIPPEDIPSDANQLTGPPPSLLEALRIFLVGVAAGLIQGRSATNARRSMLVHPSQKTAQHLEYRQWIGRVFDEWQNLLALPIIDGDRKDLIEDFQDAYDELARTVPELPAFDEITRVLQRAFRQTSIEEVNARAGSTPTVDWSRAYGWILVGGQAMDRGFTVEGLTVTYMPRGPGVGNADTIQQRGRFFGYKRPYLGFCRIYLEQDALNAFEQYVSHEEEMREQLQRFRTSGQPLKDWKRAFVLSPDLKPCRNNVIQIDYARGCFADEWFSPKMVYTPDEITVENRRTISDFVANLDFQQDTLFPSNQPAQQHELCESVPLQTVLSELLVAYRVADATDTRETTGLLLQLSKAFETDPTETVAVYRMRPTFLGRRNVDDRGRIASIRRLFQGPTRAGQTRGAYTYPGDMAFRVQDRVTIQLHRYDLGLIDGQTIVPDMPAVAVWVPLRMSLDWLVQ